MQPRQLLPLILAFSLLGATASSSAQAERFIVHGDGTVTDTTTGLMWVQNIANGAVNWTAALSYCESLTLGGYSDWRLPNTKELFSMFELSKYSPAYDNTIFSVGGGGNPVYLWSSTTNPRTPAQAYSVTEASGAVTSRSKSNSASLPGYIMSSRCVR